MPPLDNLTSDEKCHKAWNQLQYPTCTSGNYRLYRANIFATSTVCYKLDAECLRMKHLTSWHIFFRVAKSWKNKISCKVFLLYPVISASRTCTIIFMSLYRIISRLPTVMKRKMVTKRFKKNPDYFRTGKCLWISYSTLYSRVLSINTQLHIHVYTYIHTYIYIYIYIYTHSINYWGAWISEKILL